MPKRIVVGGWGLGGSLATSFAPWTAMHVRPSKPADVISWALGHYTTKFLALLRA